MNASTTILAIILAAVMAATSGCGRRGALDTPSAAAAKARGEKVPEDANKEEPEDRKFILDGLIE